MHVLQIPLQFLLLIVLVNFFNVLSGVFHWDDDSGFCGVEADLCERPNCFGVDSLDLFNL